MSLPAAKKRFGQNFLHDPQVIARLLRLIDPRPGETLVEIGPGLGALTAPLLSRCGRLDVIEIDEDVIPTLEAACAGRGELRILRGDALQVDYRRFRGAGPLRLVGNLPYNISSPLLFHLLEQSDALHDMHFMLQKEVVDRICASAGDEAYGRLSVSIAARAEAVNLFTVGPGAFRPAPKVDSAVVRLRPRPPPVAIADLKRFDRIVKAAFAQRRKQLGNTLKGLLDTADIQACGVDPRQRAEQLDLGAFARLADRLGLKSSAGGLSV
jgi:16S rRNA (adenine1518-N6/adenine1519-N6)-dimethyltransferase